MTRLSDRPLRTWHWPSPWVRDGLVTYFFLIDYDRRQGVPIPGPDLRGLCTLLWFSASSRHSTNFQQPLADRRPTKKPSCDRTNCPAELSPQCQPVGLRHKLFRSQYEVEGWAAGADQHILQTIHWVPSVPPEWNVLFRDIWAKGKKTKSKIKSSPESELKST